MRTAAAERPRLNREIDSPTVNVVGLGVMTRDAAYFLAGDRDVDLVEVDRAADPPLCELRDFGKFRYRALVR